MNQYSYENWEDEFENTYTKRMPNLYLDDSFCENEKCKNINEEIKKLTEECSNLEKKCLLIDYVKSEQIFEKSEKITELCNEINNLNDKIETYEGNNLCKLDFDTLTFYEIKLIKLYKKIKHKISDLEKDILKGNVKDDDNRFKCINCKENDINCLLRPCSHLNLCLECAQITLKCPNCQKFIEYIDKIFLPNN